MLINDAGRNAFWCPCGLGSREEWRDGLLTRFFPRLSTKSGLREKKASTSVAWRTAPKGSTGRRRCTFSNTITLDGRYTQSLTALRRCRCLRCSIVIVLTGSWKNLRLSDGCRGSRSLHDSAAVVEEGEETNSPDAERNVFTSGLLAENCNSIVNVFDRGNEIVPDGPEKVSFSHVIR
jgi:hypothetical protein